jgi:Skp family chaperone for outer membrane proteins
MMLVAALAAGAPVAAQDQGAPAPQAQQILTLDWDRLYEGSAWGRRVALELAEASQALNAENNRIAEDLIAEERALTDQRAGMDPAAFRAAAEAFDQRATGIRAAQKAKAQALQSRLEQERAAFIQAALPVLDEMLIARGASIVLDRRVIIRGLAGLDVTEPLTAMVNARLGDGDGAQPPEPADPAPKPADSPSPN